MFLVHWPAPPRSRRPRSTPAHPLLAGPLLADPLLADPRLAHLLLARTQPCSSSTHQRAPSEGACEPTARAGRRTRPIGFAADQSVLGTDWSAAKPPRSGRRAKPMSCMHIASGSATRTTSRRTTGACIFFRCSSLCRFQSLAEAIVNSRIRGKPDWKKGGLCERVKDAKSTLPPATRPEEHVPRHCHREAAPAPLA